MASHSKVHGSAGQTDTRISTTLNNSVYTQDEVAKLLGMTPQAVTYHRQQGHIFGFEYGSYGKGSNKRPRGYLYPKDVIEAFKERK